MNDVLNTLFLPVNQDAISLQDLGGKIAFLNAAYSPEIKDLKAEWSIQQYFKPYADELEVKGLKVEPLKIPPVASQSAVFILLPKNIQEAQELIAMGLDSLQANGLLICAADNKAGGSRLEKMFKEQGLEITGSLSKNKARVVWAHKNGQHKSLKSEIILVKTDGAEFYSRPGIFGWDKIDRGSQILAQHWGELKGTGADFGCGYGYLARQALKNNSSIKKLYCIDADARAVECCKKNCAEFPQVEYIWKDLTKPAAQKNLDFIIMNPPFHEGKKTDIQTGIGFIQNAHDALRRGGVLWMVANAHLPYETALKTAFHAVEKKFEGQGFKIYRCVK